MKVKKKIAAWLLLICVMMSQFCLASGDVDSLSGDHSVKQYTITVTKVLQDGTTKDNTYLTKENDPLRFEWMIAYGRAGVALSKNDLDEITKPSYQSIGFEDVDTGTVYKFGENLTVTRDMHFKTAYGKTRSRYTFNYNYLSVITPQSGETLAYNQMFYTSVGTKVYLFVSDAYSDSTALYKVEPPMAIDGYHFNGWLDVKNNKLYQEDTVLTVTEDDLTFEAQYKKVGEETTNPPVVESGEIVKETSGDKTKEDIVSGDSQKAENAGDEPKEEEVTFVIRAKKSAGGKISPSQANVVKGKNKSFTIKPDEGYEIADVLVDDVSVGKVEKYVFEDVKKEHTIEAKFIEKKIVVEPEETSTTTFTDVKDTDWFKDSVHFVTQKKLFNGISEKEFAPNMSMTRGMLVTVLYRLAGSYENTPSSFSDVKSDKYYSAPIAWAAKNQIVNGIGNNEFAPDKEISREDIATIIARYIRLKNLKLATENTSSISYKDLSTISSYASESVTLLFEKGIMTGKGDNEFIPKGATTRAEVATILMRLMQKMK